MMVVAKKKHHGSYLEHHKLRLSRSQRTASTGQASMSPQSVPIDFMGMPMSRFAPSPTWSTTCPAASGAEIMRGHKDMTPGIPFTLGLRTRL